MAGPPPPLRVLAHFNYCPYIFALALTVSKILTFQNFNLQNVGQGYGVNFCYGAIRRQI